MDAAGNKKKNVQKENEMAIMGQGLVLMIAGMGVVYVFLYVLILISEGTSRIVSRFDDLVPDKAPRKKTRAAVPAPARAAGPRPVAGGQPVKAPVPGTVLRVSVTDGQAVSEGDEILVMDVMKMETPVTAPCAGAVSVQVAVMDKVATGDTLAMIA